MMLSLDRSLQLPAEPTLFFQQKIHSSQGMTAERHILLPQTLDIRRAFDYTDEKE